MQMITASRAARTELLEHLMGLLPAVEVAILYSRTIPDPEKYHAFWQHGGFFQPEW